MGTEDARVTEGNAHFHLLILTDETNFQTIEAPHTQEVFTFAKLDTFPIHATILTLSRFELENFILKSPKT
jgi:hypothetical protein